MKVFIPSSVLYTSILVGALSLVAPAPAYAFDWRVLPLLGPLINALFPPPPPPRQVVIPPANIRTATVWTLPHPNIGTTYINSQRQRVFYGHTPTQQMRPMQIPIQYITNPFLIPRTWNNSVTPQLVPWARISQVAYVHTVPVAPNLSGLPNINNSALNQISRNNETNIFEYYSWPVPTNATGTVNYVNSIHGLRDRSNFVPGCLDGTTAARHCGVRMHSGIDIRVPHGTPVSSMSPGRVVWVDPFCQNPEARRVVNRDPNNARPAGGCTVSVLNNRGEMIIYQHLSQAGRFRVGNNVRLGDIIGNVGNSGASFGSHLDVVVCQISEEQIRIAQQKNRSLATCQQHGGRLINPLDRMDPRDPRWRSARAREEVNNKYLECRREAGHAINNANNMRLAQCRQNFRSENTAIASGQIPPNTPTFNRPQPLTGNYNVQRF